MKWTLLILLTPILVQCSSAPKKPKIGECIRKNTDSYRERVYKVQKWEADGIPEVKDMVSTKIKALTDYEPKKYRIIDCP